MFGKIENGEMVLNDAGKIADECWLEIPKHFPNAVLHQHIVMPNHVDGIVELLTVRVENFQPLQQNNTIPSVKAKNIFNEPPQNEFQKMIPRSIGSIVKGFKIGVTKWFRNSPLKIENFQSLKDKSIWQRNYHEHIIRNEQSYQNISNYIINNPSKWNDDKFCNQ